MPSSAACNLSPARFTAEQHRPPLPCPRCDSNNTKFCYFNNYNLAQPRHFCKACRRYWTQGGTLRDVPVGGSTRKSAKRCRVAAVSAAAGGAASSSSSFFSPRPLLDGGSFGGVLLGGSEGLGCMGSSSSSSYSCCVGYGGGGYSSGGLPGAGIGEGRGFNEYWRWGAAADSVGLPSVGGDCFCWQEGVAGFANPTLAAAAAATLNVFK